MRKFTYFPRNITRKSNLPPSSGVNNSIWQFLGANLTDFSQIGDEIEQIKLSDVCRSNFPLGV